MLITSRSAPCYETKQGFLGWGPSVGPDKGPFSGRDGLPGPASLEPGADIQSTAAKSCVTLGKG